MGVVIPIAEYQANLRWSLSGDPEEMVCTLGLDYTGVLSPLPADVAELVYDAGALEGSLWDAAAMINQWTFVGVTVYLQTAEGLAVGIHNEPRTYTAGSALSLPHNCAALVRKVTGLSGRKNTGRWYLPAGYLNESQVSPAGVIDGADYTSLQDRIDEFLTNLGTADLVPTVLHSDGSPSTPITSMVLDTQIATQRRRLR